MNTKWVSTWGTALERCDETPETMPKLPLAGTTVRQIIRPTTSGNRIRLRLSNEYGKKDLLIGALHIAKQVKADEAVIFDNTDTTITFNGNEEMLIPAGETIITDDIEYDVKALENIAISVYITDAPVEDVTGHRGARATTYQMKGNNVSKKEFSDYETTTSWFFVSDASILTEEKAKAVVCFGDSITDGYGTDALYLGRKPDSYTRWIDYLAKRFQANEETKHISLINEGIGGNSILAAWPTDAGKDRFERDVTSHDGVEYCIILFGVNDLEKLPDTSKYEKLIAEYKKMIEICHSHGIKVYMSPILPFGTSGHYSEASEKVRSMINEWIRSKESKVDGIIEFDKALEDKDNPVRIQEKYTHEDGLHPYDGYDVMAEAVELSMFV